MFGFKPKPQLTAQSTLRDALFGDTLFSGLPTLNLHPHSSEPWASFKRVKDSLEKGDSNQAIEALRRILAIPQMESRVCVQVWHLLRELGVEPPTELAKQTLGVVVEVGMPKGVDLVAGYADHCARYWNFSGAGVVWEHPNDMLDKLIDDLLTKGSSVVQRIGPWKEPRPAAPANGIVRLNFLTPNGLHFGQGPMNALAKDPMGGPVLSSVFQLMKALMEIGQKAKAEQNT
jgi:hypothetical protein